MNTLTIHNAKIVLNDEIIHGSIKIESDIITQIDQSKNAVSLDKNSIDFGGNYLIAGLIELHTDNMEKHFVPRPGVKWPSRSAVLTHDAQMIAAGITTVFDAISLGDVNESGMRVDNLQVMLDAILDAQKDGLTRAEHFLHLRCELSHKDCESLFDKFSLYDNVKLISLMDHAPGQRQFADINKYREYYQGKYKFSDSQLEDFIVKQTQSSKQYSAISRKNIAKKSLDKQFILASHDDATIEHVEESMHYQLSIAEFPTTKIAAEASHKHNMSVLMGAPNIVRGGSHSGNVSAGDLAKLGVLDILSSDYYPSSLLDAIFNVAHGDNDFDLVSACRLATSTPAQKMNLNDRGSIQIGKRADFLEVKALDNYPLIKKVFTKGERVF